jgi:putative membrane protein
MFETIQWHPVFKAIHIIGFASWFAALFYWVRIFIYHVEAQEKPEAERKVLIPQFTLMESRVYKVIANPAMILTLIGGIAMLVNQPFWLKQGWMHAKLGLLIFLVGYHHYCKSIMKKLAKGETPMTANKLRMFNEVATLFLVAIVLLAVFKNFANFGLVFAVLVVLGFLMNLGIKAYKKTRIKEEEAMKNSPKS